MPCHQQNWNMNPSTPINMRQEISCNSFFKRGLAHNYKHVSSTKKHCCRGCWCFIISLKFWALLFSKKMFLCYIFDNRSHRKSNLHVWNLRSSTKKDCCRGCWWFIISLNFEHSYFLRKCFTATSLITKVTENLIFVSEICVRALVSTSVLCFI
jgi:hypothetical protein